MPPKSKVPAKLQAWSAALKELKLKPPVRKGTPEYEQAKALADKKFQQYVTQKIEELSSHDREQAVNTEETKAE